MNDLAGSQEPNSPAGEIPPSWFNQTRPPTSLWGERPKGDRGAINGFMPTPAAGIHPAGCHEGRLRPFPRFPFCVLLAPDAIPRQPATPGSTIKLLPSIPTSESLRLSGRLSPSFPALVVRRRGGIGRPIHAGGEPALRHQTTATPQQRRQARDVSRWFVRTCKWWLWS